MELRKVRFRCPKCLDAIVTNESESSENPNTVASRFACQKCGNMGLEFVGFEF